MSLLADFALESGIALGLAVIMAAIIFRSAGVSFALKLIIPSMLLAFAIAAPWKVSALLGLPQPIACRDLPKMFNLIAFAADDGFGVADLYIQAGAGPPRSYELQASKDFKDALADISPQLARGPVLIKRHCDDSPSLHKKGNGSSQEEGEKVFEAVAPPKKGADE